jgi:hypothetical protein
MNESSLKVNLRVLAEQATQRVAADERSLDYFAGATAIYDTRRDQAITELPAFEDARTALGALQVVQERYGSSPDGEPVWERLTLQFVYGFLDNLSEPIFDPGFFETTWEAFWEELSEPEWTYLGVANLQNFRSESMLLSLGDGITIRGRSVDELAEMGWSEHRLEQLSREWFEVSGTSSHIILTEHRLPKAPDNLVLSDTTGYQKAARTLLALRLHKDGDVGIGRMWFIRPASFYLGPGDSVITGYPASFAPGSAYTLEEPELSSVRDLYDTLVRYDGALDRASVNLNLALRSFSDIYERRSAFRDDARLVDAVTAAEALLGTRVEVTFRLAFRVAAILGNDDDDRVRIFELMKGYYDTRSRVVHGGSELFNRQGNLRDRPRWHLENQQDLRDFVRRLLVGFLRLTMSSGHRFDTSFSEGRIDSTLLHSTRRSELRIAMGLEVDSSVGQ